MQIETILVIGSQGRMGRLFATRAQAAGLGVRGVDRPLSPALVAEAARGADLVLLAVPAAAMVDVAVMCAGVMDASQILADICSVKVKPVQAMLAAYSGPVVGTHPLFGPEPKDGETRVAVTPGRDDAARDAVEAFFARMGFAPFRTTAEEHDRAMAAIQGLNFVTTVSYFAALADRPELENFITPSFNRRLDAARKMLTEDAELFCGLMDANPFTQESVRAFRSMLNIAAGGDIELLAEKANWWWRERNSGGDV
ncbi:prephenate dehydrogenase [Desulfobaculum xiamenense]|uniref:Prephenate dehydrogenase n=1 Tax=Desulfobaculum xiamenense TaxID=995050 RepID=A0A846QP58_9BACT|nr:prephenate dehydrogenase/arogenate dehydrogenase family protein [Desulfobaculum xiamenense]NJB68262.1 prephenate dehydrogenase [Desulfobaculum xiamenense]